MAGATGTPASNQAISQATKLDHRLFLIASPLCGALDKTVHFCVVLFCGFNQRRIVFKTG